MMASHGHKARRNKTTYGYRGKWECDMWGKRECDMWGKWECDMWGKWERGIWEIRGVTFREKG